MTRSLAIVVTAYSDAVGQVSRLFTKLDNDRSGTINVLELKAHVTEVQALLPGKIAATRVLKEVRKVRTYSFELQ